MTQPNSPHSGGNPYAQGAAPQPKKPSPLPWVLVAVFAVIAAVLAGFVFVQQQELSKLRTEVSASPQPAATPGEAAPTQQPNQFQGGNAPDPKMEQKYPQITEPAGIKVVDALPRRAEGDPLAMGRTDAPVVLLVWSDFRCPFCSKWARETLPKLRPYVDSGSLRIEHRDMVLFGDDSKRAAIGARAAGLQGKFWEFAEAIEKASTLSGHPPITDQHVIDFAEKAGVADMAKFRADVASAELAAAVDKDTTEGHSLGISGTPFFVINRTPVNGAVPTADFQWIIESYGAKK